MTTIAPGTPAVARTDQPRSALGWALRRALLGILILTVFMGGAAWLLYNSIDPVQEAQAADIEPEQRQLTQTAPVSAPPRVQ